MTIQNKSLRDILKEHGYAPDADLSTVIESLEGKSDEVSKDLRATIEVFSEFERAMDFETKGMRLDKRNAYIDKDSTVCMPGYLIKPRFGDQTLYHTDAPGIKEAVKQFSLDYQDAYGKPISSIAIEHEVGRSGKELKFAEIEIASIQIMPEDLDDDLSLIDFVFSSDVFLFVPEDEPECSIGESHNWEFPEESNEYGLESDVYVCTNCGMYKDEGDHDFEITDIDSGARVIGNGPLYRAADMASMDYIGKDHYSDASPAEAIEFILSFADEDYKFLNEIDGEFNGEYVDYVQGEELKCDVQFINGTNFTRSEYYTLVDGLRYIVDFESTFVYLIAEEKNQAFIDHVNNSVLKDYGVEVVFEEQERTQDFESEVNKGEFVDDIVFFFENACSDPTRTYTDVESSRLSVGERELAKVTSLLKDQLEYSSPEGCPLDCDFMEYLKYQLRESGFDIQEIKEPEDILSINKGKSASHSPGM